MTRTVQTLLPVVTVLLCIVLTFALTDSPAMLQRIHAIHDDAFTLHLSLKSLAVTKSFVAVLLAISLPISWFLKKALAGHRKWQWERNYCLVTVLACVSLVLRLWQCPLAMDDAYIDYRYVLHWLSGQFDYNPGEHVMGFTSHLHLFVLWLVCSIFHTQFVDMTSFYLNCVIDTISTIFLFFFVSKVYKRILPGFIAALVFAVSMYASGEVISGKEAPLVSLVILLSLWGLQTSRFALLPWSACALFLLRPEGIFACLLILIRALKRPGKTVLKSFILPCGLTCAWYAFLFFYFGSVMPHGMLAKHKVFPAGDFLAVLFDYVRVTGCMVTNSTLGFWLPALGWWSSFYCIVLVFVYAYGHFKQPCWALYRDIALVQLLFLLFSQPLPFSWYLCWFALLGPILMAQLAAEIWPTVKAGKLALLVPLRVVFCVYMFGYLWTGIFFIPFDWIPYLERGTMYREAALFLMDKTHGKEAIAASDVGIIGYNYTGPILDLMGLVSDEPLKYYPITYSHSRQYLIAPETVSVLKPKYVVAPVNHCLGMLLDDSDFQSHYTELKRWTNAQIPDKVVCIWMRKEATAQYSDKNNQPQRKNDAEQYSKKTSEQHSKEAAVQRGEKDFGHNTEKDVERQIEK